MSLIHLWTQISTPVYDLGSIALGLGTIVFGRKKGWFGASVKFVEVNAGKVWADTQKIIDSIGQTPTGAIVEHNLKNLLTQASDHIKQLGIVSYAKSALTAFETTVEGLSAEQRQAIEFEIVKMFPGTTVEQVDAALKLAEKEAQDLASSALFTAANALTNAKKAPSPVAQV